MRPIIKLLFVFTFFASTVNGQSKFVKVPLDTANINGFAAKVRSVFSPGTGINLVNGQISVQTLNQNTTGSAGTLTTPRAIYGNNFDGSTALTQIIAGTYGGTGVNNGARTMTYGGNVSFSGSFPAIFRVTGNTDVTFPVGGLLATTGDVGAKGDTTNIIQSYMYMVYKIAPIIYAIPRYGSGLPYFSGSDAVTVINAALDIISDTGSMRICKGSYNLTDEIRIVGKGSSYVPNRSIVIDGDGFSTQLIQNTSGKNGIVISNRAGVHMSNLFISCGSSARSALLLDSTGTSEVSVYNSIFNHLYLINTSTTYPAFLARNFWYSSFDNINAVNVNSDAIILSNSSSAGVNYGNSSFGQIYVVGSEATGYAGLKIITGTNASHGALDHCTFANFQHGDTGDYGIYTTDALNFHFNMVDIENFHHPIALGFGGGKTQGFTFDNGFVIVNNTANDTAISIGNTSGSNFFRNFRIVGDATTVPVSDRLAANANGANCYDLWLGTSVDPTRIGITWAVATPVITRSAALGTTTKLGGTVVFNTPFTLGSTSVTATGSQLNYLNAATGTTGTTSTSLVYSTSPTLVTPTLGVATATSVTAPTIQGATTTGANLTLSSTSHATKGKLIFGSASVYDEVNDRLGLGVTAPAYSLSVSKNVSSSGAIIAALRNLSGSANGVGLGFFDDAAGNNTSGMAVIRTKYSAVNYATGRLAFDVSVDGGTSTPVEAMSVVGATRSVLINTTTDDTVNKLQVNGAVKSTQFKLSALNTAPSSASDTGTLGEIRFVAGFVYFCSATNTWVRAALTTW